MRGLHGGSWARSLARGEVITFMKRHREQFIPWMALNKTFGAASHPLMKISLPVFAATLLVASNLEAGESLDAPALASGYAQAFQCSGKSTVAIVYQGPLQTETIKDISDIKNFGGVLLVKGYGGSRQILDATRVVKITDNN
jgi:hypothetical protein